MSKIECIDPFSGEVTGVYNKMNIEEVSSIVNEITTSQSSWAKLSVAKRLAFVKEALSYFEENKSLIALDICEQMGRPLHQAEGEISGMLGRAKYLCDIAIETLAADILTDQEGFDRSILHVPLGNIFVISAWNYPLLITINSVVPALIAGNTVLLKHSSMTPKIGEHFENAFSSLGNHSNLLKNIIVDHEVTGQVIEKLKVDHVIFTGSVNGGRSILSHTSKKFMMPGLELGGKDGVYVDSTANIENAVETIVDGAMFNSGQSCCGMERAYVHEDHYEEFIKKAKSLIESYKIGDPKDLTTNLGPLASAKAADFMQSQINEAIEKGANVEVGGKIEKISKGTFFRPTLISNATHEMSLMKEENFGPILPVMKVKNMKEAIDLINDSDYGLTSAIFTANIENSKKFADSVESGTVFMNRCDFLDPALAWTGVKNSGCGTSLSKYGFMHVTRRKSLHFKTQL